MRAPRRDCATRNPRPAASPRRAGAHGPPGRENQSAPRWAIRSGSARPATGPTRSSPRRWCASAADAPARTCRANTKARGATTRPGSRARCFWRAGRPRSSFGRSCALAIPLAAAGRGRGPPDPGRGSCRPVDPSRRHGGGGPTGGRSAKGYTRSARGQNPRCWFFCTAPCLRCAAGASDGRITASAPRRRRGVTRSRARSILPSPDRLRAHRRRAPVSGARP